MKKVAALLCLGLVIGGIVALSNQRGYAKVRAPEFAGDAGDWINSPPLSMKEIVRTHRLPGGQPVHAVLVDFWEYTCVNCVRTFPYLKSWNERYAKAGLLIVGIHTPEFGFAHDKANVQAAVKRFDLPYPILVDSGYKNWQAYANQYWPRHYLINDEGVIVDDHAGEGGYRETELQIQALLKKANPSIVLPKPMAPVRDTDSENAVCYPTTPEVYAGYQRGRLSNPGGFAPDRTGTYREPSTYEDGAPVLVGRWEATPEAVIHASRNPDEFVALAYHALDAHAVIKPEDGKPLRVYVTQDGKAVEKADKGADIHYAPDGRSYITVDAPRMYDLTKNAKFGRHILRLSSDSDRFGLYSFTFGSCTVS
ncbi:MAG TPA: redoxin family protein [Armatimonadota bacterium]|jgi:thiol-disulfide isomerase/thioredoxin